MKKLALLLFIFPCLFQLSAQEIQVNEDPNITQLIKNWTNKNRSTPGVDGWRVQIMASTDRQMVESERNQFRRSYPDVTAEWSLESPYYKLRVGAYRSKYEALALISELTGWPGAYPIKDSNIHPRDFLKQ